MSSPITANAALLLRRTRTRTRTTASLRIRTTLLRSAPHHHFGAAAVGSSNSSNDPSLCCYHSGPTRRRRGTAAAEAAAAAISPSARLRLQPSSSSSHSSNSRAYHSSLPSSSSSSSVPKSRYSSTARGDNNRERYRIPRGATTFDRKVRYVLSLVPLGKFTPEIAAFCHDGIDALCRGVQATTTTTTARTRNNSNRRKKKNQHNRNDNSNENGALEQAEALLGRMEREAKVGARSHNPNGGGVVVRLTATPYNRIVRAWARTAVTSKSNNTHLEANRILQRMKRLHRDDPSLYPAPDNYTYEAVLYACTLSGGGGGSSSSNSGNNNSRSPRQAENNDADDNAPPATATELANRLVREVEELGRSRTSDNDPPHGVFPTKRLYDNVILVHANQAAMTYGAAAEAEDWLMYLSNLSLNSGSDSDSDSGAGDDSLAPDTQSFNRVLRAWCVSPENRGADRASEILDLMIRLGDDARPDPVSFGTVITAFARRNRPVEAEQVLKRALEYFGTSETTSNDEDSEEAGAAGAGGTTEAATSTVVDLTGCFNAAIIAWSKSDSEDAATRIEALLRDADTLSRHHHTAPRVVITPDATTVTCYVEALINNGGSVSNGGDEDDVADSIDGLERAESVLRKAVSDWENSGTASRDKPAPINTATFHAVLRGWRNSRRPEAAQRATDLLYEMISIADEKGIHQCHPEVGTINTVVDLWCGKTDDPEMPSRLLQILDLVEERQQLTRTLTYQRIINALCEVDSRDDAAFEAARVLARFEDQAARRERLEWNPRHVIGLYTAVIRALGRVGTEDAAELSLRVLRGIPKTGRRATEATVRTYTGVIHAFSKLRNNRAGLVAFELFEEMKALDSNPRSKVNLDSVAFLTVLRALDTADDSTSAGHACDVLAYMLELHRSGREGVEPNGKCLAAALSAMGRCTDAGSIDSLKSLIASTERGDVSELPQPLIRSKLKQLALQLRIT